MVSLRCIVTKDNAGALPQKSALVEALAFKLRVLLDAEEAAAGGSKPADQAGPAGPGVADELPSAEQDEDSPAAETASATEAVPAAKAGPVAKEDGTAAAGAAGPSSSEIDEACRCAKSECRDEMFRH